MELRFFGRGAGFADEHTSAYFTEGNQMILLDCPISTFQKAKMLNLKDYEKIFILVTHTHGDHIGGLGLLIQYLYFVMKVPVTVVAPSEEVRQDIATVLTIEGNNPEWYELVSNDDAKKEPWFCDSILTEHSPQLAGKCFGYHLIVDGRNVVYTGDTSTLEPFRPYISQKTVLYVDTSVYYGQIHLKLEEVLPELIKLTEKDVMVYLMHLDDVEAAKRMVSKFQNISVVKIGVTLI